MAGQTRESKTVLTAEDRTGGAFASMRGQMEKTQREMEKFQRMFTTLTGLGVGGLGAREIIKMSDAFVGMNARLQLVTKSQEEFASVQLKLQSLAKETRSGLDEVAGLYTALARSTKELGVSQEQLLAITGAFTKSIIISGGSTTSAAAAITQFNQAMASGVLRGEEFNSVSEQAPRIMQLLASSLGKTLGELREMAKAGQLTSDIVLPAILKGASEINKEFERMPTTIGQASTVFGNSLLVFIGKMDEATGKSRTMAGAITDVATVLDSVTTSMAKANKEADGFSIFRESVSVIFETVAVLGINVAYVLKQIGSELGGVARQAVEFAKGNFELAAQIGKNMKDQAEADRKEVDERTNAILNARRFAKAVEGASQYNEAWFNRLTRGSTAVAAATGAATEKVTKKVVEHTSSLRDLDKLLGGILLKGAGFDADYGEKMTKLFLGFATGRLSIQQFSEAQAVLLKMQPAIKQAVDAETRAREDARKALEAYNHDQQRQNDAITEQIADLQLQIDTFGKSRSAVLEYAAAQLEAQAATLTLDEATQQQIETLRARAKLLRDLAGKTSEIENLQTQVRLWDDMAGAAGNFFADLVMNGKSAFDNLKQSLKSFAAEILAFFAKRYLLQMVAGASGTFGATAANAASSAAGSMGNSLMGTALSAAGTYLFGTAGAAAGTGTATALAGGGMVAANTATATYTTAGVIGQGGLMSTITSALSAIPIWGWIAIAAMAAYAAFGGKGGGPKTGGSFQGMFDATGSQTGTNATNLFGLQPGESTGDSAVASIATATAKSYYELVKAFGGNSRALNFGLGYDSDQRGTADNRIKAQVTDAAGNSIFREWDRAIGRDQDKIAPELQLSAYRALLAALQASELPGEMGKLFSSIVAATASQADIEALIGTAKDLQYVLDGIAAAGIPDVTLESLRALQAAGESLGDVFNRVVGEFLTAQNNLNAAIGSRNPQFARDLVLSQRNGLAAQFATLVGRDFGDALLSQMALQPETFTNLNTAGMNLLANFLGLQSSLEQLDAQLAGSGTSAVVNFTNALVTSTSAITDARASLADYLNGSLLSDNSPLNPMARYQEAKRQYQANLGLAQMDNVDAISNFGRYREAFLDASRAIFASSGQYNSDFFGSFNEGANLPNSGVRHYTAADADRIAERTMAKADVQIEKTAQITQALIAFAGAVIDNASQNTAETKAVLDDQLLALNKIASRDGVLSSSGALP